MNLRERDLRVKTCQSVDVPPWRIAEPWTETTQRWRQEGLTGDWKEVLGVDPIENAVPVNLGFLPAFEPEIIEDAGDYVIRRDPWGIVVKDFQDGTMPHWLDYPIKTRADWERIKEQRLDPDDPARFPADWDIIAQQYNNDQQRLTRIGSFGFGFFGTLRSFMGVEALLMAYCDDPDWIHEITDYLCDFWIRIFEKAAEKVKIDIVHLWEDMAGKQGTLISPAMIREFMLPNYRRVKQFIDKHHIPVFNGDSDGNLQQLMPLLCEAGVNRYLPFEVAAGNDVREFRAKFPNLCICGGIDKRVLPLGRDGWRGELEKVKEMLKYPGYEPLIDHAVPPDVSWQNFYDFHMELKDIVFEQSQATNT